MNALDIHYPTQLIDRWSLRDGRRVTLRPVLPQDAELEQGLVRRLSVQARYNRFFVPIRELPQNVLEQLAHVDHRHHVALVAETFVDGIAQAVGEAQYVVDDSTRDCEFAVVVADEWQRQGIATRLVESLIEHARDAGLRHMVGDVLATNDAMLTMMRKLGFSVRTQPGDARVVQVRLDLRAESTIERQRAVGAGRTLVMPTATAL
jgi:acetyltransferase